MIFDRRNDKDWYPGWFDWYVGRPGRFRVIDCKQKLNRDGRGFVVSRTPVL